MRFQVLGPLAATVALPSAAQPRRLLALLLARPNEVVGRATIVDELWPDGGPPSAAAIVQVTVSKLRKALSPGLAAGDPGQRLKSGPRGYALTVAEGELDAAEFVALASAGLAAEDPRLRHDLLTRALACWRGGAFCDVETGPLVEAHEVWLEDRRRTVLLQLVDLQLAEGDEQAVVHRLAPVVAARPADERLAARLVDALAGLDRRDAALDVLRRTRRALWDEAGVVPGPEFDALYRRLAGAEWTAGGPPAQLPAPLPDFTGRAAELAAVTRHLRTPAPVVVHGSPGAGKSALAVQAAWRARRRFPDGQLVADLAATSSRDILVAFLRAFGAAPAELDGDLTTLVAAWRGHTADRKVLVLLENARTEAAVRPLLPSGPGCAVLVTAGRPLPGLTAAWQVPVASLSTVDARALLAAVAGEARIAAEPAAADALVACCAGLPLAVRIAGLRLAARPHLRLADLATRLGDDRRALDELVAGDLSVRAAVLPALRECPGEDRDLLRLLGLFRRPVPDWCAAALVDVRPAEVHDRLDRLASHHLLTTDDHGRHAVPRFVRLGLARLAGAGADRAAGAEVRPAAARGGLDGLVERHLPTTAGCERSAVSRVPRLPGGEPERAAGLSVRSAETREGLGGLAERQLSTADDRDRHAGSRVVRLPGGERDPAAGLGVRPVEGREGLGGLAERQLSTADDRDRHAGSRVVRLPGGEPERAAGLGVRPVQGREGLGGLAERQLSSTDDCDRGAVSRVPGLLGGERDRVAVPGVRSGAVADHLESMAERDLPPAGDYHGRGVRRVPGLPVGERGRVAVPGVRPAVTAEDLDGPAERHPPRSDDRGRRGAARVTRPPGAESGRAAGPAMRPAEPGDHLETVTERDVPTAGDCHGRGVARVPILPGGERDWAAVPGARPAEARESLDDLAERHLPTTAVRDRRGVPRAPDLPGVGQDRAAAPGLRPATPAERLATPAERHSVPRSACPDLARRPGTEPDRIALRRALEAVLALAERVLSGSDQGFTPAGPPVRPPDVGAARAATTDPAGWRQRETELVATAARLAGRGQWHALAARLSDACAALAGTPWLGRSARAVSIVGLAAARRLGDGPAEAGKLFTLASVHWQAGRARRARTYFALAGTRFEELGDPRGRGAALVALADLDADAGQAELAVAELREALALLRACGDVRGQAIAAAQFGGLSEDLGDVRRAVESFEAALLLVSDCAGRWHDQVAKRYADVLRRHGRTDRAADLLAGALGGAVRTRERHWEAHVLRSLGDLHTDAGEVAEGERCLTRSLDLFEQIGHRHAAAYTHRSLAEARLKAADPAGARRHLRSALTVFHELNDRRGTGYALLSLGKADTGAGARRALTGAADVFRDLGFPLWELRALRELDAASSDSPVGDRAREVLTKIRF